METIPKIIHQLWVGHHKVPYKFIDTWRKDYIDSNPSWQYKLWREEDIDSIDMQNREIYDKEYGYSGKADIARYEILYQHGGIWIDADAVWLGGKSLNPLIEGAKKTNFFALSNIYVSVCGISFSGICSNTSRDITPSNGPSGNLLNCIIAGSYNSGMIPQCS